MKANKIVSCFAALAFAGAALAQQFKINPALSEAGASLTVPFIEGRIPQTQHPLIELSVLCKCTYSVITTNNRVLGTYTISDTKTMQMTGIPDQWGAVRGQFKVRGAILPILPASNLRAVIRSIEYSDITVTDWTNNVQMVSTQTFVGR